MAAREVIVLGTSAPVPTRRRNQNGYVLRWDDEAILFDPGEGTQRQLLLAGVSSSAITAICITHFHGDHCLGLPGMLARFALDQRQRPVHLFFPESGAGYVDALCNAAIYAVTPHLVLHPLVLEPTTVALGRHRLVVAPLAHSVDTLGYRVEDPGGPHLLQDRLDDVGLHGPDVGRLKREGSIETAEGAVRLEDVSEFRPGASFAFIMDTAVCDAALRLADRADLVLSEATFRDSEEDLARRYLHLTARQAGWIAAEAGAQKLVLSHFSQRYPDVEPSAAEASAVFRDVVAAEDLMTVAVPRHR